MPTNGNAGAALAAYGARAGIETVVICPAETPEINVRETAAYGASVYVADGQIDECGALVGKGAAQGLWFDCSTLKEPNRLEGKKVMGFELVEQLGWKVPDAIFYPTGGGTGLIGMWKAFAELEAVGLIGPERPRMFAIQATGCAPIVRAFEGEELAGGGRGGHVATGFACQGGRDFLSCARSGKAVARRWRWRSRRSSRQSTMSRVTTACCCAPKAERSWLAGARRSSAAWLARTRRCCCSTVPTATNIRLAVGQAR